MEELTMKEENIGVLSAGERFGFKGFELSLIHI